MKRGPIGNGVAISGRQIVQHDDLVIGGKKPLCHMRADVPGTACYEDSHREDAIVSKGFW
jgi:hypothetical protein